MSRTPTLTPSDAELILGPRGSLRVTADNRATVKKWLNAQGFPAQFTAGLSYLELGIAYNDVDGSANGMGKLRAKLERAIEDDAEAFAPSPPAAPLPVPQNAPAAAPAPARDAAQLLRDLLLNGYNPGIDEAAVRSIVKEMLPDAAPAHRIEIKDGDRPTVVIDGHVHPEFERALRYLKAGANIMLVGPAGCGKSHLAAQLATALGVKFGTISGSGGVSESELNGWLLPADGGRFEYAPAEFVELYEGGESLFCFDEIDAFDPNMLLICNTALANGHMTVAKRRAAPRVKRGTNVYLMATANTFGTGANPIYSGRNPLDEATRDRFLFITVDYDKALEEQIGLAGGLSPAEMAGIWELRDRCREAQLRRVISTRAFQKAAIMKQCGDSWREIRDRLLEGWSKDEKAKVGA